jgi:hypothetical protein
VPRAPRCLSVTTDRAAAMEVRFVEQSSATLMIGRRGCQMDKDPYSLYRSSWVDPPSWFLGLIPLLLKVGAMHGTHYETTNPSLVCTHPTSSGQTAGSNLAVFASVRSSRALAGWASAAAGAGYAPRPRTARRIGRRHTRRSDAAPRATQPHFDDQIETSVRIAAPSKLGESTQGNL